MKIILTIATFATLLTASSLSAQTDSPVAKPSVSQATESTSADASLTKEQVFAKCLAITNQEEVSIAKFARETSTNEEVKDLAKTLEKSHQECLDQLKAMAAKTAPNAKSNPATSPTPNNNAHAVDFLQMHQEMSDQCLKDSKELLSTKEGADFDAFFVGMQIAKHGMMHSSLTVLQRHTIGDLQGFIKTSLTKNDAHMKAANQLMEKLSGKTISNTAKISK